MDEDTEQFARALPPENVLALSRASALASGFTQLDQFWVESGAAIARDPDSDRRRSRAEALTMLGNEMSRQLAELGTLKADLRASAQKLSDEAKTLSEDFPPSRILTTTGPGRTFTRLPGPTQELVEQVGKAVVRGIADPTFPDFVDASVESLSAHVGIPAAVLEQGAEFLARGGDGITPASVVESIAGAVSEAGIPLPPGFSEAASIFTTAVSGGAAGGDGLSLIPAIGGLIGAIFGVPALGALIGSVIEWIAERVLAEDETHA